MIFDPIYLLFIATALLLSMWASFATKSAFKKFSRVPAASGLTVRARTPARRRPRVRG